MGFWEKLLQPLRVNPALVMSAPRSTGFRLPAPNSQPHAVMGIPPEGALAKNRYYERRQKNVSEGLIISATDESGLAQGELPPLPNNNIYQWQDAEANVNYWDKDATKP